MTKIHLSFYKDLFIKRFFISFEEKKTLLPVLQHRTYRSKLPQRKRKSATTINKKDKTRAVVALWLQTPLCRGLRRPFYHPHPSPLLMTVTVHTHTYKKERNRLQYLPVNFISTSSFSSKLNVPVHDCSWYWLQLFLVIFTKISKKLQFCTVGIVFLFFLMTVCYLCTIWIKLTFSKTIKASLFRQIKQKRNQNNTCKISERLFCAGFQNFQDIW